MHLIENQTVAEPGENTALSTAIKEARASFRKFFAAHRLPSSNQTDFQIQVVFEDGNRREHIWLSHLDFRTKPATGIVASRSGIRTIRYHRRVPFLPEQMTDWMYREDGRLVGGFTTRVLLRESQLAGLLGRLKRRLIM